MPIRYHWVQTESPFISAQSSGLPCLLVLRLADRVTCLKPDCRVTKWACIFSLQAYLFVLLKESDRGMVVDRLNSTVPSCQGDSIRVRRVIKLAAMRREGPILLSHVVCAIVPLWRLHIDCCGSLGEHDQQFGHDTKYIRLSDVGLPRARVPRRTTVWQE